MKKITVLFVLLILPVVSFSGDIYDFITIQANCGNGFYFKTYPDGTLGFQEKGGFGVGVECETNIGDTLLLHGALAGAIPLAKSLGGPKMDLGLSYILSAKSDYVDFFSIFFGDTVTTSAEGTCKANFITALDLGSRIYAHWYLADYRDLSQSYGDVAEITDHCSYYNFMGYAGIRYLSVYAGIMPLQEVDVALHGLLGFVINDTEYRAVEAYSPYTVYADQTLFTPHLAYGFEACLKWYFFEFIAGYYDSDFYLEANLVINIVIF